VRAGSRESGFRGLNRMHVTESEVAELAGHVSCPILPEAEAERCTAIRLPSRALILRAGEPIDQVRTIREGWAFSFRVMSDGRRQIIAFHLAGDMLGTESLLGMPAAFSVQAITAVSICAYPAAEVPRLLRGFPEVQRHVLAVLVKDRMEREERIVALGARLAIQSFACFVLDLYDRLRERDLLSEGGFSCPLTQEMIADALGMTKVHVSRTLATLRRQGALDLRGGRMVLDDIPALRRLAGHSAG